MRALAVNMGRMPLLMLVLLALLLLPPAAAAEDGQIRLVNGELRTAGTFLSLDSRFDIMLSAAAEDALTSGVPLTLEVTARVYRPRWWWWWDAELVERTVRVTVLYHALSRRYVVHNDLDNERRTFFRRDMAMAAWGTVVGMRLLQLHRLDGEGDYRVEARARLDLDALPHPLRTVAYVSPEWRLVSDWYTWPVEQ